MATLSSLPAELREIIFKYALDPAPYTTALFRVNRVMSEEARQVFHRQCFTQIRITAAKGREAPHAFFIGKLCAANLPITPLGLTHFSKRNPESNSNLRKAASRSNCGPVMDVHLQLGEVSKDMATLAEFVIKPDDLPLVVALLALLSIQPGSDDVRQHSKLWISMRNTRLYIKESRTRALLEPWGHIGFVQPCLPESLPGMSKATMESLRESMRKQTVDSWIFTTLSGAYRDSLFKWKRKLPLLPLHHAWDKSSGVAKKVELLRTHTKTLDNLMFCLRRWLEHDFSLSVAEPGKAMTAEREASIARRECTMLDGWMCLMEQCGGGHGDGRRERLRREIGACKDRLVRHTDPHEVTPDDFVLETRLSLLWALLAPDLDPAPFEWSSDELDVLSSPTDERRLKLLRELRWAAGLFCDGDESGEREFEWLERARRDLK